MIQLNDEITISRPASEVFAFVADLNNLPRWQSDVITSKVLTAGPMKVGTRFTEEVKMGPTRQTATCEVTEFAPGTLMGFKASAPAIDYLGRFVFEGAGTGTRLTIAGRAQLKGWRKLMQPLIRGEFKKGVRKDLVALKAILEKG